VTHLFKTAREIGPGTGIVKKSPLDCTGTHSYRLCAWRMYRYPFSPPLPRPIRNRPPSRSY